MMKKELLKKIIVACLLTSTLACTASCSDNQAEQSQSPSDADIQYDVYQEKISYCMEQIKSLEAQLAEKKQEIYVSESQYNLEISALEATVSSLKAQLESQTNSSQPSGGSQSSNNTQTSGGSQSSGNSQSSNNSQTSGGSQSSDNSQPSDSTPSETGDYTYTLGTNGITITKYNGSSTVADIPSRIDGKNVVCIGESAFDGSSVQSVIIPDTVTKIDWFAFRACTQLVEITIPASVKTIEYGAFDYAKKTFVVKCQKDSYAHAYARSWGYICVAT